MGSYLLPVEQTWLAKAGYLRSCTCCDNGACGDERCNFDCPHFYGLPLLQLDFAKLFYDAHGAMRTLTGHKDQKAVCALTLAICLQAQT